MEREEPSTRPSSTVSDGRPGSPVNEKDPLGLYGILSLRDSSTGNRVSTDPPLPVSAAVDPRRGIKKGSVDELRTFLQKILYNRYGGILLTTAALIPTVDEDGTSYYRSEVEYRIVRSLKGSAVELCQDRRSRLKFVKKKYMQFRTKRLYGAEFLLEMVEQPLFPNIWGASKDEAAFYIYFEYCEGNSLNMSMPWQPGPLRLLAVSILRGLCYMQSLPAVHYDIKPGNLALRDLSNPQSVVFIDVDSMKRPQLPFNSSGITPNYMSPWHNELIEKAERQGFHQDLVFVDLWAVNCVIISLWCGRTVWFDQHMQISSRRHGKRILCSCQECCKDLGSVIASNWKQIVPLHLKDVLRSEAGDEDSRVLKRLLLYLSDDFIRKGKSAQEALDILTGGASPSSQPQDDNSADSAVRLALPV